MARRVKYIKSFNEKFPGITTLLADTGNLFSEDYSKHGDTRVDGVVKNEWMLKSHDKYFVDAVNLSAMDLRFFAKLLTKKEFAARSENQPVFKRFISANILSNAPDSTQLAPFIIREIPQSNSAKLLRVGFIGLSEIGAFTPKGFKVIDPIEAAKRVLPEVKSKADVIIVLARMKADVAARLAREVPGIHVIIAGTGELFTPSFKLGETLITFTPYEARFVGELRFYKDAQGKITFRDRFISLDEGVSDDAEALDSVVQAREAKNATYKDSQALLITWLSSIRQQPPWKRATAQAKEGAPAEYISATACAECHTDQYVKWSNSKHARATDGLMLDKDQFEAGCFECHATGQSANALPKFAAVQCEQCHGPGSLHALKPAKGYGRINDVKAACLSCHTQQISPNFDLQAAWLKMKH